MHCHKKNPIIKSNIHCAILPSPGRSADPDEIQRQDVAMIIDDTDSEDAVSEAAAEQHHFMEFYSPPRVAVALQRAGLRAQHSFDILTGYDLLTFEGRARALRLYETHVPFFTMLSPPCTMYSKMQNLNFGKMPPCLLKKRWADAHCMLDFAMYIAKRQLAAGRLFAHEHPVGASSWKRRSVTELLLDPTVYKVNFDQCRLGLRTPSGEKALQKRTTIMTNSAILRDIFAPLQCNCTEAHGVIQGSELGYQISSWCQIYTPAFVNHLANAVLLEANGNGV